MYPVTYLFIFVITAPTENSAVYSTIWCKEEKKQKNNTTQAVFSSVLQSNQK